MEKEIKDLQKLAGDIKKVSEEVQFDFREYIAYERPSLHLDDDEHLKMVKSNDWRVRRDSIRYAQSLEQVEYNLPLLINDPEWMIRAELAKHRLGLNVLINDEDPFVRMAVLQMDFLEDVFDNPYSEYSADEASAILEKLADDDITSIRAEVARRGFALNRLVDDPSPIVRYQVAHQGYQLARLCNDRDERVRNEARRISLMQLEEINKQEEIGYEDMH